VRVEGEVGAEGTDGQNARVFGTRAQSGKQAEQYYGGPGGGDSALVEKEPSQKQAGECGQQEYIATPEHAAYAQCYRGY